MGEALYFAASTMNEAMKLLGRRADSSTALTLDRSLHMPLALPKSIPRRVFFGLMARTTLGIAVAIAFTIVFGWVPARESAAVVLPLYFAVLLLVLSIAFVLSGDTLMYSTTLRAQSSALPVPSSSGL